MPVDTQSSVIHKKARKEATESKKKAKKFLSICASGSAHQAHKEGQRPENKAQSKWTVTDTAHSVK